MSSLHWQDFGGHIAKSALCQDVMNWIAIWNGVAEAFQSLEFSHFERVMRGGARSTFLEQIRSGFFSGVNLDPDWIRTIPHDRSILESPRVGTIRDRPEA